MYYTLLLLSSKTWLLDSSASNSNTAVNNQTRNPEWHRLSLVSYDTFIYEMARRESNLGLWKINRDTKLWCASPDATIKIRIFAKTRAHQFFENYNNHNSIYFCFLDRCRGYLPSHLPKTKIISTINSNTTSCSTIGCN